MQKIIAQPIHFKPYLKSVIWGGKRILTCKSINLDIDNIGESWEISAVPGHISTVDRGLYRGMSLTELVDRFGDSLVGHENYVKHGSEFPLLIKLIDAADNLSIQVHPDDSLAMNRHNSNGKTEMWTIIDCVDDAKVYAGLSQAISPEEYKRRVAENTIMDVVAQYKTSPGDVFFIPAGRIHAIGAGNLLAEIQQTSDISYRIYDFDRKDKDGNSRKLHIDEATEAIDYTVHPSYKSAPKGDLLVDCPYFTVHRITTCENEKARSIPHTRDSFTIILCLQGAATINYNGSESIEIKRFDTYLFPAIMKDLTVEGSATILAVQG